MKRDKYQRYGIVRVFMKLTPHIIRCAPWSFAGAQCGMASYGIILGLNMTEEGKALVLSAADTAGIKNIFQLEISNEDDLAIKRVR